LKKLDLAWREIEYTDSLLSEETFTDEKLLDHLIQNPSEINNLKTDSRYRRAILKFEEGGLI